MRLCSSAVCLCESDCKCVCFHPLDGKDGLLLFISPWLQDYRGTARKAVWQQVADAKMSTKICIQARTIPVCMWASPLIVNPFSGNRKCMTRLLTHLFCSSFPSSVPTFSPICLLSCSLSLPLLERLPQNPGCVCLPGVLSGMWNVWPCGKDADSKGSVPGAFHPVFAAGEPQGHRQALCGGHGEIYRGLWLQGDVSLIRHILTFLSY